MEESILTSCANCSLSLFQTNEVCEKRGAKKQNKLVREIIIKEDPGQVVTLSSFSSDASSNSPLKRAKATTTRQDSIKFKTTVVKVHTALTEIYKLNILTELTSYADDICNGENEEGIGVCQPCALALTDLYVSLVKFNRLRKESYLTKKIEKLDDVCSQIESTWSEHYSQTLQRVDDENGTEADTTTAQPQVIDVEEDDDTDGDEEEEEKSTQVVHKIEERIVDQDDNVDDASDSYLSILDNSVVDTETQQEDEKDDEDDISIIENPMEIETREEEDVKTTSKNNGFMSQFVKQRVQWQLSNKPSIVIEKLDDELYAVSQHASKNMKEGSSKSKRSSPKVDHTPPSNVNDSSAVAFKSPDKVVSRESTPPPLSKTHQKKENGPTRSSSTTTTTSPSSHSSPTILTGRRRTNRINYSDQMSMSSRETSPAMDGNESDDSEKHVVPKKKTKIVNTEKAKVVPTKTKKKSTEKNSDQKPSASSSSKTVSSEKKKEQKVDNKKVSKAKEPSSSSSKTAENDKDTQAEREKEILKANLARETIMRKRIREILEMRLTDMTEAERDTFPLQKTPLYLANKIQEELTLLYSPNDPKWRAKYLNIRSNLNDAKNSLFREILQGSIEPKKLVRMEPTEMASTELTEWRNRENEKNLEIMKQAALDKVIEAKRLLEKGPYEDAVDVSDVIGTKEDVPSPDDVDEEDPSISKPRSSHASSSSRHDHRRHHHDRHHKNGKDKKRDKENRHSSKSNHSTLKSSSSSSKDKDKNRASHESPEESKKSDHHTSKKKNDREGETDKKKDKESSSRSSDGDKKKEVEQPKLCVADNEKEKDNIPTIVNNDDDDDIIVVEEINRRSSPSSSQNGRESPFFRFSLKPRRPASVRPKPIEKTNMVNTPAFDTQILPAVNEKYDDEIENITNGNDDSNGGSSSSSSSSSKNLEKHPLFRPFRVPKRTFKEDPENNESEKCNSNVERIDGVGVKKAFSFYKDTLIWNTEEEDDDDDKHDQSSSTNNREKDVDSEEEVEDKILEDLENQELFSLVDLDSEKKDKLENGEGSSSQPKSFVDNEVEEQDSVDGDADTEDDDDDETKPSSSSDVEKGQEQMDKDSITSEHDDGEDVLLIADDYDDL